MEGTDYLTMKQIAEINVFKDPNNPKWDLWIDNTLWHCDSLDKVMVEITSALKKRG